MIKLFSLKQQKKDGEQKSSQKKSSAAQLRIQKGKSIFIVLINPCGCTLICNSIKRMSDSSYRY